MGNAKLGPHNFCREVVACCSCLSRDSHCSLVVYGIDSRGTTREDAQREDGWVVREAPEMQTAGHGAMQDPSWQGRTLRDVGCRDGGLGARDWYSEAEAVALQQR